MASAPETVAFLLEQLAQAGPVTARKMFGDYGLFLHGKMVAIVCDDRLFVKDLPELAALLDAPERDRPFPGSKPHLLLEAEVDDADLLSALIRKAAEILPEPKPKRRRE